MLRCSASHSRDFPQERQHGDNCCDWALPSKGFSCLDEHVRSMLICFTCFSVLQPGDSQHLSSLQRGAAEHRAACFRHPQHCLGVAHQVLGQLTALTEYLNNSQTSRSSNTALLWDLTAQTMSHPSKFNYRHSQGWGKAVSSSCDSRVYHFQCTRQILQLPFRTGSHLGWLPSPIYLGHGSPKHRISPKWLLSALLFDIQFPHPHLLSSPPTYFRF